MRSNAVLVALLMGLCLGLVPASASADMQDLIHGQLNGGLDQPTGGHVDVYVMPDNARQRYQPNAVYATDVSGDGGFTVMGDPARLAPLGTNGWVTFMVEATNTQGQVGEYFFSHYFGPPGTADAASSQETQDAGATIYMVSQRGATAASAPKCRMGKPIIERIRSWKAPVVVGEINNAYSDSLVRFEYGQRADTSIQTGLKLEGRGWMVNGSKRVANSASASVGLPRHAVSAQVRTNFMFGKYRVSVCGIDRKVKVHYSIVADRWVGGINLRHQSHTTNVCVQGNKYLRGGRYFRNNNRAVTWQKAVWASPLYLAAQSGYSFWVRLWFDFGHRHHYYVMCGEHGVSELQSQRVYTGLRPGARLSSFKPSVPSAGVLSVP